MNLTMSANEKVWLRRSEARELLGGMSEQMFTKLIAAGTLTPKVFPGATRAVFERTEVEACKPRPKTETRIARIDAKKT